MKYYDYYVIINEEGERLSVTEEQQQIILAIRDISQLLYLLEKGYIIVTNIIQHGNNNVVLNIPERKKRIL